MSSVVRLLVEVVGIDCIKLPVALAALAVALLVTRNLHMALQGAVNTVSQRCLNYYALADGLKALWSFSGATLKVRLVYELWTG